MKTTMIILNDNIKNDLKGWPQLAQSATIQVGITGSRFILAWNNGFQNTQEQVIKDTDTQEMKNKQGKS